eukprot:TRINITY_DN5493_c0_g2_i1.p1 TRINITY_DN5493_c0_g2~~TRINITY_DN5493_c0_g2_i1.p1  ORF type:complete len:575 (-),score=93.21 TRINITY_DN5493_c0_g2_i1:293-2017(-)
MEDRVQEKERSRHTLHTLGSTQTSSFEVGPITSEPTRKSTGAVQGSRSRALTLPAAVQRRGHGSVKLVHDELLSYHKKARTMTLAIYAGYSPEEQGQELLVHEDSVTHLPTSRGGLSRNEVVANLVIACVGAGVVVFPKTMDSAGAAFAIPLLGMCAFACSEAAVLICYSCSLAETLADLAPGGIRGYEALARHAAGSYAEAAVMLTKNFAMIGFTVVFMVMEVSSILSLFDEDFRKEQGDILRYLIQFAVVTPLFVGLAFIKDLRILAKFNTLGMLAVLGEIAACLCGAMFHYFDNDACQTPAELATSAAGVGEGCLSYKAFPDDKFLMTEGAATATCLFAFAVLGTIPSLRSQCADPSEAPEAIRTGFFLVFLLYATVMGVGYLGYGEGSPDNILKAVAAEYKITGMLGSFAIMINILITAPLFIICVLSAFESTGTSPLHTPMTGPNCVLRIVFVISCGLISAVLPYVCEVIGLVSSCFGVLNNMFYPVAFMYALRKTAGAKARHQAAWKPFLHGALILLGLFTMVFGIMGSYDSLERKMNESASSQAEMVSSTTTTRLPSSLVLESVVSI